MGLISASIASTTVLSTYLSTPAILSLVGFTKGGIVAGSVASGMMSASAVAGGGAVASGSLVSVLQSAGATGAMVGGPVGAVVAIGVVGAVGAAALVLI